MLWLGDSNNSRVGRIVEEFGTPMSKRAESQFFGTGTSSAPVATRFFQIKERGKSKMPL